MKKLIAQTPHLTGTIGEGEGFGLWTDPGKAIENFTTILSNIIGFMTIVAGIWFMFQFIIAGYGWLTSGGDKAGLQQAQSRMTNAFIGLVIVVAAYAIIWIFGELFGLKILQPQDLIKLIGPGK